jgi:nitrite reductase (NO-forming)
LHTRVLRATKASAPGTLPLLLAGLAVLGLGCLVNLRSVVALGVLLYLLGLARVLAEVVDHARKSPAVGYAGWSIGAALAWFALSALGFGLVVEIAPSWVDASARLELLVPVFAVGFAAQILLGALSYLLPVVLGGGPGAVKATARELDRVGLFRVIIINGGIVLYLLPVPGLVRGAATVVVLAAFASFLVLMGRAMRANRQVRQSNGMPR